MLELFSLPQPVTLRVLELVTDMYAPEDGSWKHRLQLLAVCSALRHLALPLVFRHAYISADGSACHTNIGLITQSNRTLLVRTIQLTLDAAHLAHVISQLAFDTHSWAAVRTLGVRILGDEHTAVDQNTAALAQCMAQNMRCVTCLELTAHSGNGMARVLGNTLVDAYSEQLRVLRSTVGLQYGRQGMLPRLECLSITMDAHEQAVPRVDAQRLRHLALRNVALPPPWHRLADGRFARLRHLELEFCHYPLDMTAKQEPSLVSNGLSFPALERLWLDGYSSDKMFGSDGSFGVLPAHLHEVRLFGNIRGLRVLSESNVASTEQLHVSVDSKVAGDDEDGFYHSTNRMFGTNGVRSTNSTLVLFDIGFVLDPTRIAWNNLVSLSVLFTVKYSVIHTLLQMLPNLRHLASFVFDQTDLPADPESAELSIAPLETCLQMVCIYNSPRTFDKCSVAALELLLLQTQSLRFLVIHNPELFHAVHSYVNRHKPYYVHLNNLQVKVGEYHLHLHQDTLLD